MSLTSEFSELAFNAPAKPWRIGNVSHNLVSDQRTIHSKPFRDETQEETDAQNIEYFGAIGLVAESVIPGAAAFMAWCSSHVAEIQRGLELLDQEPRKSK
jgi:hypothetical protein